MKPFSVGITGGIGSGKSFVSRCLEAKGIPVFYTDVEARLEMLSNVGLHHRLSQLLQTSVLLSDGSLNKPLLSDFIRKGHQQAAQVNELVHPLVRERFNRWKGRQQEVPCVVMECALLFEAGFDQEVDLTVCVTAPLEVRIKRVMERDGKTCAEVQQWIEMQMADDEKERRAHLLLNNDGRLTSEELVNQLLTVVRSRI